VKHQRRETTQGFVFSDRSMWDNKRERNFGHSATTKLTGALYFKTTPLEFSADPQAPVTGRSLSPTRLKFTGGSNLGNDFSAIETVQIAGRSCCYRWNCDHDSFAPERPESEARPEAWK